MALQAGTIETLKVERQAPFGYFLTDDLEDVLLHENEIQGQIDIGEKIDVFLYRDKQQRLAATMTLPDIQLEHYGWGVVSEVIEHMGVFVNIGITKEILLSKDDLPKLMSVWPKPEDKVYVRLKTDKKDRLLADLAPESVIKELTHPASTEVFNTNVEGRVYRAVKIGTYILTTEGFRGFIHESQRREEPRLGQLVQGRVIDVKEDGTLNISLLPRKQERHGDAERIEAYMQSRGGAMPLSDKSSPEDIQSELKMSKGAFKRALGKLIKEKKVYQEDGWTFTNRSDDKK
ncbi:S1 RNA-binding domain-containing protein [Caldalkalibacillus salinus]|uniref:CvfB family protein n=1 Tax=Caldalkalibacillus salinus TaxID=2803787 RepID=UPI001921F485|nr:S1-like domain-containing RNA-binding protein [Caldalkalibacillus salinus]